MRDFLTRVVGEGEIRYGRYMSIEEAQWSRLGDAIVVREMDGTFVTFLDARKGGAVRAICGCRSRSMMRVTRQHAQTEISELVGGRCTRVLAAPGRRRGVIAVMYVCVDERWHRFFLDAGLLFWDELDEPLRDDDLDDGEEYIDFSNRLTGQPCVSRIRKTSAALMLEFSDGNMLRLVERDVGTFAEWIRAVDN